MSTADIAQLKSILGPAPQRQSHLSPVVAEGEDLLFPDVELVETDGMPMDSDWHRMCLELLLNVISFHFRDREDYYAGGNMIVYYSLEQARNRDFCGPDFFFINGVSRLPMRPYWCLWKEGGRAPEFVIELLSPTTAQKDLTTKKEIYRTILRTPEYVCYDHATGELIGWRLHGHEYVPVDHNQDGRLWSDELGLFVGPWEGEYNRCGARWLRFFDANGNLIPTAEEWYGQQAESERQRAASEIARLNALLAEKDSTV
jgi:Uma2 family endonuclease